MDRSLTKSREVSSILKGHHGSSSLSKLLKSITTGIVVIAVIGHASMKTPGGKHTDKVQKQEAPPFPNVVHELLALRPTLDKIAKSSTTKVIWLIQDPLKESLIANHFLCRFNNRLMSFYNHHAQRILHNTSVIFARSNRELAAAMDKWEGEKDGRHVGISTRAAKARLLANVYCQDIGAPWEPEVTIADKRLSRPSFNNSLHAQSVGLDIKSQDGSETRQKNLSESRRPGLWLAVAWALASGMLLFLIAFCLNISNRNIYRKCGQAILVFGVILLYFLACDRWRLFSTEEKRYDTTLFCMLVLLAFIIAIILSEESSQVGLLTRDCTDEWKGWMQIVILVYHYTGASQNLLIYKHIRVLVSSYLFLTGYGHFRSFYTTLDFSFRRFSLVLFRMNFLTAALCVVMQLPYQAYYFVPLVSFWFVVIFATARIATRLASACSSKQQWGLTAMLILLTLSTEILHRSQIAFGAVFGLPVVRHLFTLENGSLYEWNFRWSLDRYSVLYGVAFAFVVIYTDNRKLSCVPRRLRTILLALFSVAGISVFEAVMTTCQDKAECNRYHPVLTVFPILAYIYFRHLLFTCIPRYSYFFAAAGKISLELFIAQYHIWLADDTHQLLVIVPNVPSLNLAITSAILIFIANEIHEVTTTLTTLWTASPK